jgi:uncharacterized protein YcbK (DUF882 family)
MTPAFMAKLQALRMAYGKPMRITSGFRCAQHPIEAKKMKPGAHASGCACDVAVDGQQAYHLIRHALQLGFTGIGVNQKTSGRFIHLDMLEEAPRPNIWSY